MGSEVDRERDESEAKGDDPSIADKQNLVSPCGEVGMNHGKGEALSAHPP